MGTEILKIGFALMCKSLFPSRLHTRLCRMIYNYASVYNKGIDWVINYQPVQAIPMQKILINTKEFMGWNILFLNHYEQATNLIIYEKVLKGYHVVEAGAHIGSETLLLASQVGPEGKVYAFEPNPIVMKRLQLNIAINNWEEQVETFDIALGENEGGISFYIKNEDAVNQGMSSKYKFDNDLIEIKAQQQTLDNWVRTHKIPKVDFLKMDVQGGEMDILNGASETLSHFKPLIFVEADDTTQAGSYHTINELYQKLVEFHYSIHLILGDGSLQKIVLPHLKGGNWLAIPENTFE